MMEPLNCYQKQKVNMSRPHRLFSMLLMVGFSQIATALPSDNEHPMRISADSTLINYKTGVYTYEGNVKIKQGTTQLIADRLVTKSDTKHKMQEGVAYGLKQLAEYSTIPKEGDKLLHAQAKIIRFYPPQSIVVLENNVIVTQGENSFQGKYITYNIKDQIVTAPSTHKGRATIIIEPEQLKS